MTGKLSDLTDHLFAQLARLSDRTIAPDALESEIKRTSSMVEVADRITDVARLQLGAAKLYAENGDQVLPMLPQIGRAVEK